MILFHTQDIDFKLPNKRQKKDWLRKAASLEHRRIGNIGIIFCSDAYLLKMNRDFLGHDYYTDVITFPYQDDNGDLSGDIFIDVTTVKENATLYGAAFLDELDRVMVHGLLHLMGYLDYSPEQEEFMHLKEDTLLTLR